VQSVAEIVEDLRRDGGRVTPQRIAVLEAISESTTHPTVDEIFDQITARQPSLSRKTVYQIVYDFAEIGAINLVDVGTGQIRIDPTVEDEHDHFVCSHCHCVYDVPTSRKVMPSRDAQAFGEIDNVEVVYRGLCKNCSK
jgi:Fe2+ or Zn2+ uptake regulation protein